MRLSVLLAELAETPALESCGDRNLDDPLISKISADSRNMAPGTLFVALKGSRADGRQFAREAVARGAVAVLSDQGADLTALGVPMLRHPDPRRILALMAARMFPRQPGRVVAVTGTSGKTSVAEFARQIADRTGARAASLGTLGIKAPVPVELYGLTTPDPLDLHRALDQLSAAGVDFLALEASSHGLDQRRLDGLRLTAAAFTNLSRDHFDYHGDEAHYFAAKRRLFDVLLPAAGTAVLNADIEQYAPLAEAARARGQAVLSFGAQGANLRLLDVKPRADGQRLRFALNDAEYKVDLPLYGAFQAANVLAALALCLAAGLRAQAAIEALKDVHGVPGRMQRVGRSEVDPLVFVDYAHKPDALAKVLDALRPHVSGKLKLVFGCGGDRDAGKRAIMGEIAARGADHVIVTDDNPRSEDPAAIRTAILTACPEAEEIGEREQAIRHAVASLNDDDALIIAGKGHETGQIVGTSLLPFDDAAVARDALRARLFARTARREDGASATPGLQDLLHEVDQNAPAPAAATPRSPRAGPGLWTGRGLAASLGAQLMGRDFAAYRVVIDSREVQPGDLFIALRGPNNDGHQFLDQAIANGAVGALVERFIPDAPIPTVKVDNSFDALRALGYAGRMRSSARVVGITGSVGKTSVKASLQHVLRQQADSFASAKSHNNHWGVPLSLSNLPPDARYGVFELGMNHKGEITNLVRLVRPHVAAITTIAPAHLAHFDSVEAIADAKGEIFFNAMDDARIAVLERDSPYFEQLANIARGQRVERIITFGQHEEATCRLRDIRLGSSACRVEATLAGQAISFNTHLPGQHVARNALVVLAVAYALGADTAQAAKDLATVPALAGRGLRQRLALPEGGRMLLIDDSYNANPASMVAALDVLGMTPGRRIAVLGDMLELGPSGPALHRALAETITRNDIEAVFTVGSLMRHLHDALPRNSAVQHGDKAQELLSPLLDHLRDGDVVLIKGSLGARMSALCQALQQTLRPLDPAA